MTMHFNLNHENYPFIEEEMDASFGTHFDDQHFYSSFDEGSRVLFWVLRIFFAIFGLVLLAVAGYIIFFLFFVCCKLCKGDSKGFVYRNAAHTATETSDARKFRMEVKFGEAEF